MGWFRYSSSSPCKTMDIAPIMYFKKEIKKMEETEMSLNQYYKTGQYKNFYKLKERRSTLTGHVHVTFTNGIKEVFADGKFTEAALEKIFTQIDRLRSRSSKKESYSRA